jgi:hypothetical protein
MPAASVLHASSPSEMEAVAQPPAAATAAASSTTATAAGQTSAAPASDAAATKVAEAFATALRMFQAENMQMARDFVLNPDLVKDQEIIGHPDNFSNTVAATVRAAESIVADHPSHPSESAESDYIYVPATIIENHSVGVFVRHAVRTSSSATDPASRESLEQFAVGRYIRSEASGEMLLVASDIPYGARHCLCLVWLAPPHRANRACLKIVCDQELFNQSQAVKSVMYFEHSFRVTTSPCAACAAVVPAFLPSATGCANTVAEDKCKCSRPLVLPTHALDFSHNYENMDTHSAVSAGTIKVYYPPAPGQVPCLFVDKSCHLVIKIHRNESIMMRLRARALSQRGNVSRRVVLPRDTFSRISNPPSYNRASDNFLGSDSLNTVSGGGVPSTFTSALNNLVLNPVQQVSFARAGLGMAPVYPPGVDTCQTLANSAERQRQDELPNNSLLEHSALLRTIGEQDQLSVGTGDMQDTLAMFLTDAVGEYGPNPIPELPNADRDPHEGMLLDHFGFGQMASTARVPLPVAGSSIVRTSSGRRRRSSGNFNASDQQLSAEMRRKLSNRASAARSNARRKARFDALKQSLEDVKQRVLELKQKHEAVSQENTELKQAVGGAEPDQGLASASFEDWSSLSHGLDAGLFGQLSDL